MRAPPLIVLCFLVGAAPAADWDLSKPPQSMTERKNRAKAQALWEQVDPLYQRLRADAKETVEPEEAAAALETIGNAVSLYEKSLRREWNAEANRILCQAVQAWFKIRSFAKDEPPADPEARKKYDRRIKSDKKARAKAARKLVMEYGSAQRHEKQIRRCPTCQGRRDLRSPFGDKRPCQTCARRGVLSDKKGIVKARWMYHSPFYRADARRLLEVNRIMRIAAFDTKRLAPFTRSVSITGIEDHGDWVRVNTKEKIYRDPASKKNEKVDKSYVVYRVGSTFYIYHYRYDRNHLDIPDAGADN
ncbi:MAG: hypothetical protein ACYTGN_11660 [Planctomycetota bacterium]|jgi:hypothetical protein